MRTKWNSVEQTMSNLWKYCNAPLNPVKPPPHHSPFSSSITLASIENFALIANNCFSSSFLFCWALFSFFFVFSVACCLKNH